ncbi:MAG: ATP-grasp domain-containing protein [Gemmatimonadetes bacterium]|nr:ATP-grasp domain-containing protein [Gemmatimonadota bacterium]
MNYFRSNRFLNTLPDWETGEPIEGALENYLPRVRALLHRMDNPQARFSSVIVGGTNGKGTVSYLLAELLRAAGFRVGLYTSPHLHTVRERICVDGEVLARDVWAEGVAHFYEKSRDFEREGWGAFSKFEALTVLAAHHFARANVDWAVFEVGLGGQFDATNAWDSKVAVLTAIHLDHTDVLGNTLREIAADKVHIARSGRPLFTGSGQVPEVLKLLERECALRGAALHVVDEKMDDMADRPVTFRENAALSVGVARHVVDGCGMVLADEWVRDVVLNRALPGRFEVVRKTLILDGAHNPDAVRALVRDLQVLSDKWRFVVGVNKGHDARGILQALSPLAAEVVLTQSAHPKAISVARLSALVPEGLCVRCETGGLSFLTEVSQQPTCVLGSLYLVALAREVLDLPGEADSFGEDVILESLRCFEIACRQLDVGYEAVSADGNVIRVERERKPLYFLRNKHPFNDYVSGRLAEDKGYQYEVFDRANITVPKTMTVFNPLSDRRFDRYKTHASVSDIVSDVVQHMSFPVVVKRNRGSMAQGVYLEANAEGLHSRLQDLCVESSRLDNVLLIQAYVEGPEYRIVGSEDELLLAYEKQNDSDIEGEDINPLHRVGGRAVAVVDEGLLEEFRVLTRALNRVLNLGFYAIDLIASSDGFFVLEVNPNPICHFYNADNGRGDFVQIYRYLIRKYLL